MKRLGSCKKHHSLAYLMKSKTPVEVLAVHEKPLIEKTNLFQRGTTDQPKPSGKSLHVPGLVMLKFECDVTVEQFPSFEKHIDVHGAAERVPYGWKAYRRAPIGAL